MRNNENRRFCSARYLCALSNVVWNDSTDYNKNTALNYNSTILTKAFPLFKRSLRLSIHIVSLFVQKNDRKCRNFARTQRFVDKHDYFATHVIQSVQSQTFELLSHILRHWLSCFLISFLIPFNYCSFSILVS